MQVDDVSSRLAGVVSTITQVEKRINGIEGSDPDFEALRSDPLYLALTQLLGTLHAERCKLYFSRALLTACGALLILVRNDNFSDVAGTSMAAGTCKCG